MVNRSSMQKVVLSALFVALGLMLPFLTGQIKQIGNMLLPMHIPVILCGFICLKKHGLCVGFILPLLRSAIFGMPAFYPTAIAMAFELAAYGFFAGLIYEKSKKKNVWSIYKALIISMICGRLIWGLMQCILLGFGKGGFGLEMFLSGAVINAIPGIIVQLIVVPPIVMAMEKQAEPAPMSRDKFD